MLFIVLDFYKLFYDDTKCVATPCHTVCTKTRSTRKSDSLRTLSCKK
ncbi:hypothetical protein LG660_00505 [Coxiella-like endosymbiont]|nr:hypothetical protein LG660_00505 [Coxiella-like endosymbiont]